MMPSNTKEIDPYGLTDRGLVKTKEMKFNFIPLKP